MARNIKFPLKMQNGAEVRTLEELRNNFDIESVIGYYANGQLVTWLKNYYYDDIADKIDTLDKNAPDISKQVCEVFGVEYVKSGDISLDEAKEKLEQENLIKQLLTEEQMKCLATNDEEMYELIENGAKKVYLAFGSFDIIDDSVEYIEVKGTNPIITDFYYVNEYNIENAKKYADNGVAAAQYKVGLYYAENNGFQGDMGNILESIFSDFCFRKNYMCLAADQDYFNALEWISKNDCTCFEKSYLTKTLSKAEKGDIQYQMLLGNYYRRNRKVDEAVHWLSIVAQSNSLTGKSAKKMFENYDYYFVGDGINETPSILGNIFGGAVSGIMKNLGSFLSGNIGIVSSNSADTEENNLK